MALAFSKHTARYFLFLCILFMFGNFLVYFYKQYYVSSLKMDVAKNKPDVINLSTSKNSLEKVGLRKIRTNNITSKLREEKTVLMWHVPFGDISVPVEYLFEKSEFSSNPVELKANGFTIKSSLCGNCKFTFDRNNLEKADSVMFHGLDVNPRDLPNKELRNPNQLYVHWNMETIPHSYALDPKFMSNSLDDFYNVTMSVRLNSDIYSPYGSISWLLKLLWYKNKGIDLMERIARTKTTSLATETQLNSYLSNLPASTLTTRYEDKPAQVSPEVWELLKQKNRISVWIVSNCGWSQGNSLTRKSYMDKLKRAGLKVDVFGKCGVRFPVASRWDPGFHVIVSRYKFYFSFENSFHCKGYTSEKLWLNALYSGAVPVIFGPHRDDVAAVLPPKSYILVEDFSDHHDLLKCLQYLDKNVTAYAEYLEWRSWIKYLDENGEFHPDHFENVDNLSEEKRLILYKFASAKPIGYCALCDRLYESHPPKTVKNLKDWIQNERTECTNFSEGRDMFWSSQKSTS